MEPKLVQVIATNSTKQKLFNIAMSNFLDQQSLLPPDTPEAQVFKIEIQPKTIKQFERRTRKAPPESSLHKGFFTYTDGETGPRMWVSFANKYLGGGFLGGGYVQEEIITLEFYQMTIGIVKDKLNKTPMKLNEAYVWENLVRSSISNPDAYGKLSKANLSYPEDIRTAHFLSIDAPRRPHVTDPYTLTELQHLCVKSFVGFTGCVSAGYKEIHTGNWGAGVFHNRRDVIYFVQFISAWLTGVKQLHFWAYEEKDVEDITILMAKSSEYTFRDFVSAGLKVCRLGRYTIEELYAPILI